MVSPQSVGTYIVCLCCTVGYQWTLAQFINRFIHLFGFLSLAFLKNFLHHVRPANATKLDMTHWYVAADGGKTDSEILGQGLS